jgi:hypothetical protein
MMQKTESALWLALAGLLGAAGVYWLLRQEEAIALRVILTTSALLVATLAGFYFEYQPGRALRQALGTAPTPATLALCALAGLAVWPLSWWAMSLLDQALREAVGPYLPTFAHFPDQWALEVIYMVVILPLASSLLIFGMLRPRLGDSLAPIPILILSLFFGSLAVFTTPQGLAGLVGYGLLGGVIALLCQQTRSFWPALPAYGAFMYANLSLLDNLLLQLGDISLTDPQWLAAALVSVFATLVLVQVIRFRNPDEAKRAPLTLSATAGLALVGLALLLALYTANELQQRNQNEVEIEQQ